MLRSVLVASAVSIIAGLAFTAPAQALTMKECSTKYNDAKTAGTLGDMKWNDFRKAQCGADTPDAATMAPAAPAKPTMAAPAKPAPTMAAPAAAMKPAPTMASAGVMFPNAVSPQYSTLSPGKARMQTCLDQYKANASNGGNGELKWIMKGGGYYSQCNSRLK